MKKNISIAGKTGAILFVLAFTVSVAWGQNPFTLLHFKNGKVLDTTRAYTLEEVKEGVVLRVPEGLEIKNIYQVRGNRPVRRKNFDTPKEMESFDLYAWGKDSAGASANASASEIGLLPGDRFVFELIWKGNPASLSLAIK